MSTVLDLGTSMGLTMALGPDLVLMVGAMVLLLWAAWRPDSAAHQRAVGIASMVVAAITLGVVLWYHGKGYTVAQGGQLAIDGFRWMADVVILVGTILTIGLAIDSHPRDGVLVAESHVLVLLASSGMMLLAGARDLMIVFLGIELMSIAVYALAGINRRSVRSAEGALKYFLLGAFSTAFLLYGIALIYGATGSTNLTDIGARLGYSAMNGALPLVLIGIALILVGFAFKVAAVPFHMWAPDVYDGAPSPITAYMAATVKAAAFIAFARTWLEAFPDAIVVWRPAVAGIAIVTMVIGNAVGLAQRNIKRMLAYSSIGHAGYLLVALASGTAQGTAAMIFYLFVYTLATFGAFAVLTTLQREGTGTVMMDDMAGLWSVRPWLALGTAVIMLALLGFPIFGGAGFFAKYYVLQALLSAPSPAIFLAVVLVLTTVVSAGYYLHVVMVMFMRPRVEGIPVPRAAGGMTQTVLVTSVLLLLAFGFAPDRLVRLAGTGIPDGARPAPPSVGMTTGGAPVTAAR